MHDKDWTAALCVSAKEYEAECELRRLGITVYLPQRRQHWAPPGAHAQKPMLRRVPLFKGYIFILAKQARYREVGFARHLWQPRPLLCSNEGRIWSCSGDIIFEIARAEHEGKFDDVAPSLGDRVRLKGNTVLSTMELVVASLHEQTAQLFSPLFQGCRVKAKTSDLTRAA